MTFSQDRLKLFHTLQKGYEGEVRFYKLLKQHLTSECIVLYDLLLDRNDSLFQLDCIILQQHDIWHLEVKNYEGDFMVKDNTFYGLATEKEIHNPLHQIDRGKRLLKELLEKHGYAFPVKPYVVFVHPEFALYDLQPDLSIILPGQIRRFIYRINQTRSKLSSTQRELARILISLQASISLSDRLPVYDFDALKKGIPCLRCNGYLEISDFHGRALVCDSCGVKESRESAVVRNIDAFRTLFPGKKVTTKAIWAWCGGVISTYKIRKVLLQYFSPVGVKNHLHFVPLETDA